MQPFPGAPAGFAGPAVGGHLVEMMPGIAKTTLHYSRVFHKIQGIEKTTFYVMVFPQNSRYCKAAITFWSLKKLTLQLERRTYKNKPLKIQK